MQVDTSKSSVRRRYSARYVVRRNYPGDCKRLFDTPANEGGISLKYGRDVKCHTTYENPEIQNLDEVQEANSCKQVCPSISYKFVTIDVLCSA